MSELSRSQHHELYYYMKLTRALEERLELLFRQGRIVGGLYRSLGQEAQSVGAAYALAPGDWFSPAIRNMGAMLTRGIPLDRLLLQYMSRVESPTKGKDNITHFHDRERGFIGPISPLGTTLCVLAGVALSFKLRGERRVAMTFLGDGGSRTGAAHEGMNFAAVQRLPFVVVIEHNGWAFGTRTSEQTAQDSLVEMARAYGVHGAQVDGNDVLAVYGAAKEAVDRARAGGGMTLIEVKTYRRVGHAQHDAQAYVPPEELEAWRLRDPIDRYIAYLRERGLAGDAEIADLDRRVEATLEEAVERALAGSEPEPEVALEGVYAGGAQPPPWARAL